MRITTNLIRLLTALLCIFALAAGAQAKSILFEADLVGTETDPAEAAYHKFSGGFVRIYQEINGDIKMLVYFRTRPEHSTVQYTISLELGGCTTAICYGGPPYGVEVDWGAFPITTSNYAREAHLIDEQVWVDPAKGEFEKEYLLIEANPAADQSDGGWDDSLLPPHIMSVETPGVRVQAWVPQWDSDPGVPPFATGFRARTSPPSTP